LWGAESTRVKLNGEDGGAGRVLERRFVVAWRNGAGG